MNNDNSGSNADNDCKPFLTKPIPTSYPVDPKELIADKENAARHHLDILGWSLFQARNDILDEFTKLGEDQAYRAKLGKVKAQRLEAFANLDKEARQVALTLAEDAMDSLIKDFEGIIRYGHRGYGGGDFLTCIEYHLQCRLLRIVSANANGVKLKKIYQCDISNERYSAIGTWTGRWLTMFGKRPSKNISPDSQS